MAQQVKVAAPGARRHPAIPNAASGWRRWGDGARARADADLDRVLLRAVRVVALLLALVVLGGVARHAPAIPDVTLAAGMAWLAGCAGVLGWAVLAAVRGSRARGPRR